MSRESIIQQTLENQDFMQRVSMTTNVIVEIYRMLVSTLLILFVPQDCDGHLCTLKENLVWQDHVYNTSLTFNFITLFAFITLYGVEIVRENRMISYLEVNPKNPRDNTSVATVLENLPASYHKDIYTVDYIYQKASYACLLTFMINTILSGITIYKYNYGNQTTTTFITNVLFMTTKVYSTYYIANTDKSIFYSAYLYDRVQYNDIDPNIKSDIEKGVLSSIQQPNHYTQLREPSEILTHEIDVIREDFLCVSFDEDSKEEPKEESKEESKEEPKEEPKEESKEDVTKDLYPSESVHDLSLSLGFPLELPRDQTQVEFEFDFPIGESFIDLPNEVGPEDPNKEVIDLIRESVKEVLTEIRRKMVKNEENRTGE
jgi:hypothetical protein